MLPAENESAVSHPAPVDSSHPPPPKGRGSGVGELLEMLHNNHVELWDLFGVPKERAHDLGHLSGVESSAEDSEQSSVSSAEDEKKSPHDSDLPAQRPKVERIDISAQLKRWGRQAKNILTLSKYYTEVRSRYLEAVQSESVHFVVPTEEQAAAIPPQQQGCHDFYSDEGMIRRMKNKLDPRVKEAVMSLWRLMPKKA